ncbi:MULTISPECIES: protein TolR [unclassified Acidisoma]|jgi:biopolymer transport protein TolR|uniref:protein TolR n=1 Tax=unclassified Acidisoma TaxID=2634065 RepID=UPI00131C7297
MAIGGMGGPRARGRYKPLAEINVTPLVDVMLVLLIIFMVTAPLMTSGVTVDLPKTAAKPVNADSTPITLSINAEGKVFVQNDQVQIGELVGKLESLSNGQTDRRIFVRGDQTVSYGQIMQVMGTIVAGGFTKVALLAQQPNGAPMPTGAAPATTAPTNAAPAPAASAP